MKILQQCSNILWIYLYEIYYNADIEKLETV